MRSRQFAFKILIRPLLYLALIAFASTALSRNVCDRLNVTLKCSCYNTENEPLLECSSPSGKSLRGIFREIRSPIRSLSLVDLDEDIKTVTSDLFPAFPVVVRRLQFSRSSIEHIQEDAFSKLKNNITKIGFTSGKLRAVPQKAFRGMKNLVDLDLEGNQISEIPEYALHGLNIMKLSLKENSMEELFDFSFAGLELSLKELDLTENKLKYFPSESMAILKNLAVVRLAWNEISEIRDNGRSRFPALKLLDLSSNQFETIPSNGFRPMPALTFLSLHSNFIATVHREAFVALILLESLDLSHNKIILLDSSMFKYNKRLKTLDLSNNHIHRIGGLFEGLPDLREIFLTDNNVLEVPRDAFTDSFSLSAIYLDKNAIRRLEPEAFHTLPNLTQVHLTSNYLRFVPKVSFSFNPKLTSLSLDKNEIRALEMGVFTNLTRLREIKLQNNKLEKIEAAVFQELTSLEELNLKNNEIRVVRPGIFKSLNMLKHINIEGNQLETLETPFLQDRPPLISLRANSNRIKALENISLALQKNLQMLWLGNNRITRLHRAVFKDLEHLRILYLPNNSVSVIEDRTFESLKFLVHLDLSGNRLTRITRFTLHNLAELDELNLSDNMIEHIESYALTSLKKLSYLNCAGNRLKKLQANAFREKLSLRRVNLENCRLKEIEAESFEELKDLEELNLKNNRLEWKSVMRLKIQSLKDFELSGNAFGEDRGLFNIRIKSLENLILDNASISHIANDFLAGNGNLKFFSLANNALRNLSKYVFRDSLNNLEEIRLNGNLFTEVPYEALSHLNRGLKVLNLSNNFISSVDFAQLNRISSVRVLDFRNNKIENLTGFGSANATELTELNLSWNLIESLPKDFFIFLSNIEILDLSHNGLREIPAGTETTFAYLKRLTLTGNPISRFNLSVEEPTYSSLLYLKLSRTNLSSIVWKDFRFFSALRDLDFSGNRISVLTGNGFIYLSGLQSLNLSGNELESIRPEYLNGLQSLKVLDLSKNGLKRLEGFSQDLKELRRLDLSTNKLHKLDRGVFVYLKNLKDIQLKENWISRVAPDSFRPLKSLENLDLGDNYLEKLPLNAFRPLESHLRRLRVDGNRIRCDCEDQELWEWFQDHRKIVRSDNLKCENPEVKGLLFIDSTPREFCHIPLIIQLSIQDIQPFSMVISWQSRNHSGFHGYAVMYTEVDANKTVQVQVFDRNLRSLRIGKLEPDTRYLVCVAGLATWTGMQEDETLWTRVNLGLWALHHTEDFYLGRCTHAKTLETPEIAYGKGSGDRWDSSNSILTRRLGLIVGCCMGIFVFFVLISVLGYMKIQKQRRVCNRSQPLSQQYLSYRHYSIPNGEAVFSTGHVIGPSISYF